MNATSFPLQTYVLRSTSDDFHHQSIASMFQDLLIVSADYDNIPVDILPTSFAPHYREWKHLLTGVRNQGQCGSCWSFASTSCLADRLNIQLGQKYINTSLSPLLPTICDDITQMVLEKDPQKLNTIYNPFRLSKQTLQNNACHGNTLISACYYLCFYGTTLDQCVPYTTNDYFRYINSRVNWSFRPNNDAFFNPNPKGTLYDFSKRNDLEMKGSCAFYQQLSPRPFSYCIDNINVNQTRHYGTAQQIYQALFVYDIDHVTEEKIRFEIFKWGPVCSAFVVYQDFYEYDPITTPVYIHDATKYQQNLGGHAVEIVGWGSHNGIPFWWIKNSWGPQYGIQGYFRYLRGSNQCEIETNVICMMPNLFYKIDRVPSATFHEQQIKDLHIFHTHPTSTYKDLLTKVLYSLDPNPLSRRQDDIDYLLQKFPLLHFHVITRIGYQNTRFISSSGYVSNMYRQLPGMNYTAPTAFLFNFYAGKPSSRITWSPFPYMKVALMVTTVCLFMMFLLFQWWTQRIHRIQ